VKIILLTSKKRQETCNIPANTKKIKIETSREKCMDVLTEVINSEGEARGKPLQKWLPQIPAKNIAQIRFTMNDFSSKPIKIKLEFKN